MADVFKHDADTGHILNPTGLKNLIRKRFYPSMQHDSHEFLMHIISELQDEETPVKGPKFDGEEDSKKKRSIMQIQKEYFKANPSGVDAIFTGLNRSIVKCINCQYESMTYKPFTCLSVTCESSLKKSLQKLFEVT